VPLSSRPGHPAAQTMPDRSICPGTAGGIAFSNPVRSPTAAGDRTSERRFCAMLVGWGFFDKDSRAFRVNGRSYGHTRTIT